MARYMISDPNCGTNAVWIWFYSARRPDFFTVGPVSENEFVRPIGQAVIDDFGNLVPVT